MICRWKFQIYVENAKQWKSIWAESRLGITNDGKMPEDVLWIILYRLMVLSSGLKVTVITLCGSFLQYRISGGFSRQLLGQICIFTSSPGDFRHLKLEKHWPKYFVGCWSWPAPLHSSELFLFFIQIKLLLAQWICKSFCHLANWAQIFKGGP